MQVINGGQHETLTEVVARRLRGQLAERRIKRKDLVEMTGWGRATVYRRLSGQTPLNTDEMETLWRLFRISPAYLMSGKSDDQPSGPGPDDDGVRPKGFEPLTFCDITDGGAKSQVIYADFGRSDDCVAQNGNAA